MAKIAGTFDQEHADAVVAELGRMNVDGLDWRVEGPGAAGSEGRGVVPFAGVPGNTAGGARAADGGPAVAPPLFAAGSEGLTGDEGDAEDYLRQARNRGATLITVEAPSEAEAMVRGLFERHSASNVTTD
jgi:hypothetical protein